MDYTELITTQHRAAPKFMAYVGMLTSAVQSVSDVLATLPQQFDIDTAVGAQLDVIGQWVGVTRRIEVPFNNWFSFDIAGKGFDEGVWRGPFDPPSGLQNLDDTAYRRVLRAFIKADHWDGTFWNYHAIIQAALPPAHYIEITDNWNMSVDWWLYGPNFTPLLQATITNTLTRIRPAGVRIANINFPP